MNGLRGRSERLSYRPDIEIAILIWIRPRQQPDRRIGRSVAGTVQRATVEGTDMDFCSTVGEVATVFPRWWGKSWSVIYAGAVSDDGFSLPVGRVCVASISASEIRFRFDRAD